MPYFRIVTVNYNAGKWLGRCIEAVARQSFADFDMVIVDNASRDGSADLDLPDSRFRWIKSSTNLGFAAGCNLGAMECQAPWLIMLNPDAFPREDWLERIREGISRHPGCPMFGCTQIDAEHPAFLDGSGDCLFFAGMPWRGNNGHPISDQPPEGEVFGPCGAAAVYDTELFFRLGGFDERFFCFYEDVDLAFRIRLAGGHCIQLADAAVFHVGTAIAGRRSDFVHHHSARNRIWLYLKNMPGWSVWFFLPFHLALNLLLLVWAIKRGHARAVLRGLREGLSGLPAVMTERRKVQSSRKANVSEILRILSWSPLRMLRRNHDVRPLSAD